jgi:predicted ATP-dependent endonuclease of OLD family
VPKEKSFKIRLNKLKLVNFKCFDEIELEFPKPFHKEDLDVFVMGSQNGLGKTSILEACSLLFLSLAFDKNEFYFLLQRHEKSFINITDYFIKSGKQNSSIVGYFEIDNEEYSAELEIRKEGLLPKSRIHDKLLKKMHFAWTDELLDKLLLSAISVSNEPFILPPSFMYFNSNRKIQAGSPELGEITDTNSDCRKNSFSKFKIEIIKLKFIEAKAFENITDDDVVESLNLLASLFSKYADGKLEKPYILPDNKTSLRIKPVNGEDSYSFDGLSSGQKEIISTLYLIWKNTYKKPGIVLIDEPELHLNAEWQAGFMHTLNELMPYNQYIIATHSERIFASVEPEYRALLRPDSFQEEK